MAPGSVNSIIEPPGPPDGEAASLAQIVDSGIPITWYEGLAVVQQMCRALIDQPGHPGINPSSVFVQANGDVRVQATVSSTATADSSVQSLGQLLRTWIEGTPCPVPLGLVVAQATGTPPFYSSVAQLSEALSHYERSSAADMVRGVYKAFQSATAVAPEPPRSAPLPSGFDAAAAAARVFARWARARSNAFLRKARERRESRTAPAEPKRVVQRRRWRARVAGGAIIIALAIVIRRELPAIRSKASALRPSADVSAVAGRVNNRIVDALTPVVGRVLDWLGIHLRQATAPSPDAGAVPPVVRRARPRSPAPTSPRNIPPVPPPEPDVAMSDAVQPPPSASAPAVTPDAPAADASAVVYSAADEDVTPPIPIDQQFRDAPSPAEEDLAAIDIVVDETGRVESATLISGSGTLQPAMLGATNLSAVKTWRFNPAVKAGRPVKYRRTVWVSTR